MKFVWAFLRHATVRALTWRRHTAATLSTLVGDPVAAPVLVPPSRPSPPIHRRSNPPLLFTAQCSDTLKWWCGPVAVAAIIGVDVAAVRYVIRWYRNGRAVKGTYPIELQSRHSLPAAIGTLQHGLFVCARRILGMATPIRWPF